MSQKFSKCGFKISIILHRKDYVYSLSLSSLSLIDSCLVGTCQCFSDGGKITGRTNICTKSINESHEIVIIIIIIVDYS